MLCVIICEIFTSWAPINVELFLADSVGQPMVSHIHCFRSFLFYCFVHDAECSGVICSQRRWGLCVTQLGECYPERGATLGVVKTRANFSFCRGCHHVFDDGGDIKDGPVKCVLLGDLFTRKKQTSETALCVGDREVRSIAVDVQDHVGGVVSDCCVRWVAK
jgi:hypothetical protein